MVFGRRSGFGVYAASLCANWPPGCGGNLGCGRLCCVFRRLRHGRSMRGLAPRPCHLPPDPAAERPLLCVRPRLPRLPLGGAVDCHLRHCQRSCQRRRHGCGAGGRIRDAGWQLRASCSFYRDLFSRGLDHGRISSRVLGGPAQFTAGLCLCRDRRARHRCRSGHAPRGHEPLFPHGCRGRGQCHVCDWGAPDYSFVMSCLSATGQYLGGGM